MREINQEYSQILLKLVGIKVSLKKVYLLYAITERMINVHHGLFNQMKCFTIIKKKQFTIKMQL